MKRLAAALLIGLLPAAARAAFRASDQGVLLCVGRTEGSFGAIWTTDVTIFNAGSFPAVADLVFLPTGGTDNRDALGRVVEVGPIAPGASLALPDVLASRFGLDRGLGAMLYFGARADAPAVVAPLIVQARVFAGDSCGPIGALEPGSPYFDEAGPGPSAVGADAHVLTGLEEDEDFRTNVGVWNGSDPSTSIVVEVDFFAPDGLAVGALQAALPPLAHLQWNGALARFGASGKGLSARARLISFSSDQPGARPYFYAYGSVTSNSSNDASYIEPSFAGLEPVDCIFQ